MFSYIFVYSFIHLFILLLFHHDFFLYELLFAYIHPHEKKSLSCKSVPKVTSCLHCCFVAGMCCNAVHKLWCSIRITFQRVLDVMKRHSRQFYVFIFHPLYKITSIMILFFPLFCFFFFSSVLPDKKAQFSLFLLFQAVTTLPVLHFCKYHLINYTLFASTTPSLAWQLHISLFLWECTAFRTIP